MNFFSRQKSRIQSPSDTVRLLRENIGRLEAPPQGDSHRKATDDISRHMTAIKSAVVGEADQEPSTETVTQVANEVYAQDVMRLMVVHMEAFEFEARKDACTIINALLRRQIGTRLPTVEFLTNRPDTMFAALKQYSNAEIALNTGGVLKEMLRYEPLARILLYSEEFYTFPHFIETTTFGISCDAFANMKECLTKHKPMVAQYLDQHYDRFFKMYQTLILSSNYVTKRQSLKLLGEILLDRANYAIMTRFIADEANLKTMMNFLRDKSRNIQFEAFHVFKVFVANPSKPPQIASILRRNKERLLTFLKDFHNDKEGQLAGSCSDEKAFLITQIQQL
ncbi:putative transcriptional repressor [Dioszegia hungarica]|uniref:Transcriptional repressor n=1 Tax=Dioszegia hungarica TaxID=4972 RepID=A0AA38HF95_9TREE|nr:putative transcriptional repressor [Dioszegia hungarica]KAI9638902.1 putative transcriptional repressor [Dioszegia hungarica]